MLRKLSPVRRGTLMPPADAALPAAEGLLPRWSVSVRSLAISCGSIAAIWLGAAMWRIGAGVVVPWDSKSQFYAFFRFLASAIGAGATPFWNPYHYGGHPSIADPQSLIFAPLFVLWAFIDGAPSMQTFDLIVYAHLLIGGLAIGVYGWRADWPPAASVLAAAVFMFGASASGRLEHTGLIITYGLFPAAYSDRA